VHQYCSISILRPQAIGAATHKIEMPFVAKKLKLLPDFRFDVLIVWINAAQSCFEGIDIVDVEFACRSSPRIS
jgi:hypothetical protein